jgi:CheY-like chemotaxis protein
MSTSPHPSLAIIDDDDDDLDFFSEAAQELAVPCVTFKSATEALEQLELEESHIPEYIFLDLNMPVIGGQECLVALKRSERLQNVKVIIYSTTKLQSIAHKMMELGAFAFITKPTRFLMLKDIILKVFEDGPVTQPSVF